MKKVMFLFICWALPLQAQEFNPKTIALTENPTNAELQFLKEELKGKQVVLLGESTHFDGNVFDYRNKITDFLFKEMGFTTIAFESGFFDVYKAKKEIKVGENINFAFQNSLMGAWGFSKEAMQLVELYKKYNPKILGFDNQFTNNYGFNFFHKDFYNYLKNNSLNFPFDKNDFELLLESLNEAGTFDEGDIPFVKFESYFEKLLILIKKLPKSEENFYWYSIIESFLENAKDIYTAKDFWTPFTISKKDSIRDKQMAKNLLEYIRKHPKEKIICWGANVHFMTDISEVTHKKLQNVKVMGTYLKKELGNKVYSLAGVTANTEFNYNGKKIKTPIENLSFESYMLKKNSPVIFIKAKQKTLKKSIKNRLFANDKFVLARLDLLFDGYLFFKNYQSSKSIKHFKSSKKEKTVRKIIKGKVVDTKTQRPLEMAEIIVPKLSKSVFTDKKGNFEFKTTKKNKIYKIQVNYLGYEPKEINIGNYKVIELKEAENILEEVVITSNKQAIRTLKGVLNKVEKNYQTNPLNCKRYIIADYKIKDSSYLKLKVITSDYDRGFMNKYRPAHQVEQIKWIKGNNKKRPKNIRELIQPYGFYQAIFNKRKLKKFSLKFGNDTIIDNKKITVISFSTPRQQYIYTLKFYKCKYQGKVYINEKDKAIVRFEESFKVTEFMPDDLLFSWYLPFKSEINKFKIISEKKVVSYKKHNNKKYYVSDIKLTSIANAFDDKKKKYVNVSRKLQQSFFDYNYKVENIFEHQKYNVDSFKRVKYKERFWNSFELKDKL